jgi:hypothetical protein
LIFADGVEEKVAVAKAQFPKAAFVPKDLLAKLRAL